MATMYNQKREFGDLVTEMQKWKIKLLKQCKNDLNDPNDQNDLINPNVPNDQNDWMTESFADNSPYEIFQ